MNVKCAKCKRSVSKANFNRHLCLCESDIQTIKDLYNRGVSVKQIREKYTKSAIKFVLKNCRRSISDAAKLAHINNPESYKLSDKTKEKIRQKQIAFLKLNTATSFQRRQNGQMSYGEQRLHDLFVKNDIYKKYDVVNEYCEYPYFLDFAFVNEKVDVEIDGSYHFTERRKIHDKKRDEYLRQKGWRVFRIAYYQFNDFDINTLIGFIGNAKNKHYAYDLVKYYEIKKQKREAREIERQKRRLDNSIRINKLRTDYEESQRQFVKLILDSNIDFSKFGWVKQVAKIICLRPQKVNKWMKRFMLSFYNEKCFKIKTTMSP